MWKSLVLLSFIISLNTAFSLSVVDTINNIKSELDPYIDDFSEQYDDFQNSDDGRAHQENVQQKEQQEKLESKLARLYQKPCIYCPSNQFVRNLTRQILLETQLDHTISIEGLVQNTQSMRYYYSTYLLDEKEVVHGREYVHDNMDELVTDYVLAEPILRDTSVKNLEITYVSYHLVVKISCKSSKINCVYNLYENKADYVLRLRERLHRSWVEHDLVIPTEFDTLQEMSFDDGKVRIVGKGVASTSGYNGYIHFDIYRVKGDFIVTGDYQGLYNEYAGSFKLWKDISLLLKYRLDYYDEYDPTDLEKLNVVIDEDDEGQVESYILEIQKKF